MTSASRALLLGGAVLAAGAFPGAALAAPDRTAPLDGSTPAFAWDGSATGALVVSGDDDTTLLEVRDVGSLSVAFADGDAASDVDLYLYRADDAGDPTGDPLATSENNGSDEKIALDVQPGRYVVQGVAFYGVQGTFKGRATLVPSAPGASPAPAAPAPGRGSAPASPAASDPPPTSSFTAFAPRVRARSLRFFRGTARDDGGIAAVGVAVVRQGKPGACRQLTARGTFARIAKCTAPTTFLRAKGTTAWSLKLAKPLPTGRYVAFARAVDRGGQTQAGFTPANRKAFTVR